MTKGERIRDQREDSEIKGKIRSILIKCRMEHKLTQEEVGRIVGKSKNAVASWEQGLSMPDAITLHKLATYYKKDMNFIYGWKGNRDV